MTMIVMDVFLKYLFNISVLQLFFGEDIVWVLRRYKDGLKDIVFVFSDFVINKER